MTWIMKLAFVSEPLKFLFLKSLAEETHAHIHGLLPKPDKMKTKIQIQNCIKAKGSLWHH